MGKTYNLSEKKRVHHDNAYYQTKRWKELTKALRTSRGFCEACHRNGRYIQAVLTDHINPIKQGGEVFEINNLQVLCHDCHNRKSQLDGSFGEVRVDKMLAEGLIPNKE